MGTAASFWAGGKVAGADNSHPSIAEV